MIAPNSVWRHINKCPSFKDIKHCSSQWWVMILKTSWSLSSGEARFSHQTPCPSWEAPQLHIHNPQDRFASLGNCSRDLWYINPVSPWGLAQESLPLFIHAADMNFSPIFQGRNEASKHVPEDWLVNGHTKHSRLFCLWISVATQQMLCSHG